MVQDTKLYDVLGINADANDEAIKKAYKTLSKKWHPDKNPDNIEEATKMFQQIAEAYAILSDSKRREQYDRFGKVDDNNMSSNFDPRDLFEQMMGNMGGFQFGRRQAQHEDCIVEHDMTLENIYNEKTIVIKYNHKVSCDRCNGTGSNTGKSQQCTGCNGSGNRIRHMRHGPMIQQIMSMCDECNGTGDRLNRENQCDVCSGTKHTVQNATFDLKLNQNMTTSKIVVENKGHITKQGRGRLIISLREQQHPIFRRQGRDLHIDIKLKLYQSMYGFNKMITHLNGKNILLQYDNMLTAPNVTMKVCNMGMKGDLYVHITTTMPRIDRLDENENAILRKLLTKAHLTEYQKEQNITKNAGKLEQVRMEEIVVQSDQSTHHDMNNEQPGVQCAQQ